VIRILTALLLAALLSACRTVPAVSAREVSFPTADGGVVFAFESGTGRSAVVLAHGGRFDRSSWAAQARVLAAAGFRVLAIDFRGYGRSRGGVPSADPYADLELDVLAAVLYLRQSGARTVSVVGGSMGGGAAAQAAVASRRGTIDRLVLLAPSPVVRPEGMQGRKLFVIARDDPQGSGKPRLPDLLDQYDRAPQPKELLVLEGAAHAQHLFETEQGPRLMQAILEFLSRP
jgi:pimeloyl-ACP methyl ester carboxylesterase